MIEHALNECAGCFQTWYVRGVAPSLQCPRCRGRSVTVVPAAITLAPEAGRATPSAADRTRFWIMLGRAATVLGIATCGAVRLIVLIARDRNRSVEVARNLTPADPSSETRRSAPLWREIENVSATQPHEYRRSQPQTSGECILAYPAQNTMGGADLPRREEAGVAG